MIHDIYPVKGWVIYKTIKGPYLGLYKTFLLPLTYSLTPPHRLSNG